MKKNNDNPIVQRILKAFGFTKLSELYRLIGKTSQNINGMINRGTLIKNYEVELIKRNVNIDWIKTGQGDMLGSPSVYITEQTPSFNHTPAAQPTIDPDDLIAKTIFVLKSKSLYSTALHNNILAFHLAVVSDPQLNKETKDPEKAVEESKKVISDINSDATGESTGKKKAM